MENINLSDRKNKILQVVVDDYIAQAEPVSSKKVQERHLPDLSSATIRGELAALEEMGFLEHPHTSAGRVPLIKAYRYYVDKLMERGKLSRDEIEYIEKHISAGISDAETLVKNAAKVISDITDYAGLGIQSEIAEENIQNIKLVQLSQKTVLLIVITDTKVISDSVITMENSLDEIYIDSGSEILKNIFCGKKMSEAIKIGESLIAAEFNRYRELLKNILNVFREYLSSNSKRVFTEGASKILAYPEFSDVQKARNFLSLIDSKQQLANMLKEGQADSVEISVKIGSDQPNTKDYSIVTANYSLMGKTAGSAGVIGPIRMDYRKVVSVLECIKNTIDEILNNKL